MHGKERSLLDREAIIKFQFQREGWGEAESLELIREGGLLRGVGAIIEPLRIKKVTSLKEEARLDFLGSTRLPIQSKSADQRERTSNKRQISL